jgi:hypothetical protein
MTSRRDKNGKTPREGFEVGRQAKEPGRRLQRKPLPRHLDDLPDSQVGAAHHGEDNFAEPHGAPPKEDRAG